MILTLLFVFLLGAKIMLRMTPSGVNFLLATVAALLGGIGAWVCVAASLYSVDNMFIAEIVMGWDDRAPLLLLLTACVCLSIITILPTRKYIDVKPFFSISFLQPIILAFPLVGALTATIYLANTAPIFGWDVLDHWGLTAVEFNEAVLQSTTDENWRSMEQVHPPTVSIVLGLFSAAGGKLGFSYITSLPWLLAYAAIVVSCACHSYMVCRSKKVAWILGGVAATMPLLSEHATIVGYAEIFITMFLVSGSVMAIYVKEKLIKCGVLLLAAMLISTLKNTGFIYAFILLIAAALSYGASKEGRFTALIIIFFSSIFFLVAIDYYGDLKIFDVANRSINFSLDRAVFIPRNMYHSIFLNLSFSVTGLFIFGMFFKNDIRNLFENENESHILLLFMGLLFFIILSQLTSRGLMYATPESDTGNSRFSIPMMSVLCLYIPYLIRQSSSPGSAP